MGRVCETVGDPSLIDSSIHRKAGKHAPRDKRDSAGLRAPQRAVREGPARPPRPVAAVPTGPRLGWREAILATVTGLGYELVEVERAQRGLLHITIDRMPGRAYPRRHGDSTDVDSGEFITVDDCEQVTRQLQYALEVENMDYARLEVSSPGLDRPLKSEADLQRFAGHDVHVTLKAPFQGRKAWNGVLEAGVEGGWALRFKQGKVEQQLAFKWDEVREARLVPVVDFKGRKPKGQPLDGGEAGAAPAGSDAPGADGG
jgi:ribosome maturation factor RimP